MRQLTPLAIVIALFFNSCSSSSGSSTLDSSVNYELNKMSLEEQEKSDPIKFLSSEGTYRETLLGGKMVLEGTISNSASVATYKDIVLEVVFYSKTKSEIDRGQYTVYEYSKPNSTIPFKFKVKIPSGTASVGWHVVSAKSE